MSTTLWCFFLISSSSFQNIISKNINITIYVFPSYFFPMRPKQPLLLRTIFLGYVPIEVWPELVSKVSQLCAWLPWAPMPDGLHMGRDPFLQLLQVGDGQAGVLSSPARCPHGGTSWGSCLRFRTYVWSISDRHVHIPTGSLVFHSKVLSFTTIQTLCASFLFTVGCHHSSTGITVADALLRLQFTKKRLSVFWNTLNI